MGKISLTNTAIFDKIKEGILNQNHPKKGSIIKVEPIREKKSIKNIKKILSDNPRDLCFFTVGINTAFRANELLSLRVRQVKGLNPGDSLEIKQTKTSKYRAVVVNNTVIESIQKLLREKRFSDDDYLFKGKRGLLTVSAVSRMVKNWCKDVGLKGNYASHSLRKTWGYWQRIERNTPIPLLMEAFGHATQRQTLGYLGIQEEEIKDIYSLEL